jgi:cytochrome c551/c552
LILFLFINIDTNNNRNLSNTNYSYTSISLIDNNPQAFYKSQCAFCHTSDELIAPDMNKIKAAYLTKYKTEEAFVKAMTDFVLNPSKDKSIYPDSQKFETMPKMPFKEVQIKEVAAYIFETSKL